jgi:hypothetical protein
MGKKSSKAPAAPDPQKTAAAEAQYNRLDTYSPTGSGERYGYTDASGNFVQGVAPTGMQSAVKILESPQEALLRSMLEPASISLTQRVIDDNVAGMPDAARVQDRSDVASDIFNRNFSLMKPAIEQGQTRLLTNLQSRGIPIGSEAFSEAYGAQQRETEDTISRLAQDANVAAGQEQSRQFGLDSAARQGSIAELVAALGGGYNPPSPVPSGNAPSINYSGMVNQKYQADLNAYNSAQQSKAQSAGALGSIAGGLLMKSTRTSKSLHGQVNITAAADAIQKMPLLVWRYLESQRPPGDRGDVHIGPMAEAFHGLLAAALQHTLLRVQMLEAKEMAGRVH